MNALPQENQSNLLHLINRGSEALPTVIVALTILFLTHYAANGNRRMSTVAFFTKCMSTRYQVFGPYFVPGYSHQGISPEKPPLELGFFEFVIMLASEASLCFQPS